ncbi:HNH endonuclease [Halorubellus salinus]|uniref:HNH endonuclease n=1 Tax=Halorubellus salinus TaxID=755309 RepID=UPI001D07EF5E|nr:HNH endonuclease signature motif containing protein [Halorubellus salinus]
MRTQEVLARLKRATTDRVPATRDGRSVGAGREFVLGDTCQNCARDTLAAAVEDRALVPGEPADDRNQVTLCDDCHAAARGAAAPSGDSTTADAASVGDRPFDRCAHHAHAVDVDAVRARDDHRCRGCGVREHIVVGDTLHVHPVVPIDATGYRHAHNYVSLCPTCHRRLHD